MIQETQCNLHEMDRLVQERQLECPDQNDCSNIPGNAVCCSSTKTGQEDSSDPLQPLVC